MKVTTIILCLFAALAVSDIARSNTMDRMGTGSLPDYYKCTQIKLAQEGAKGASGGGNFHIGLKGFCGVHPGDGLAGWTPVAWEEVYVRGDYNYATQKGDELIRVKGQVVFSVGFACTENPWMYPPGHSQGQSCSVTVGPINKTGVEVGGPYPISPRHLDGSLILSLREAEDWKSPEDALGEWNPYPSSGGAPVLTVVKPENFEMINQTIPHYVFVVEPKQEIANLAWVKYEIEMLEEVPEVIGDIAMPQTYSHWWQPFWSGAVPASLEATLMGITQGLFAGTTGKFRFRVIGTTKNLPNKENIGGWSPWRYFCIGDAGTTCQLAEFWTLEQSTIALKAIQKASFYDFAGEGDSQVMQQKKQHLALQMEEKALIEMKATIPAARPTPARQPESMAKVKPGKVVGGQASAVMSRQHAELSLLLASDSAKMLTIKLQNATPVTLEDVKLAIKHPYSGAELWHKTESFPHGIKLVKINHADLDKTHFGRGKRDYDLMADNTLLGKVAIVNVTPINSMGQSALQLQDTSRPGQAVRTATGQPEILKTEVQPGIQPTTEKKTARLMKPELDIELALQPKTLKANDKATLMVTVKNVGTAALGAGEGYSLKCSSACPFRSRSGRLSIVLQPGGTERFRLDSDKLEAGDYEVQILTHYGNSQRLQFSVQAETRLQRVPAQRVRQ